MRRLLPFLLAATAVLLSACGGKGDDAKTATAPAPATTPQDAAAACRDVPAAKPKDVKEKRPTGRLASGHRYVVTLRTNCGDIAIQLDPARQPRTAASFAALVRDGVYDGTSFHRIVPDFVIQGGDPKGDGTGGPGYTITEKPPHDTVYTRGVVAMAKTEIERPGTSGSQFFIVTAEDAQLPPDYAVVGKVVGSDDAVTRIAAVRADADSRPTTPVVIEKATLARK